MRRFSLEGKIALLAGSLAVFAAGVGIVAARSAPSVWLAVVVSLGIVVPVALWAVHRFMAPVNQVFSALLDGVSSLRDSDFSFSVSPTRQDELGDLVAAYNDVGTIMRDERQALFQRELLLDTVMQTSPLALVLTGSTGAVVYSNTAARHLLHRGRRLEGLHLADILSEEKEEIRNALRGGQDGLFTVEENEEQDTYHLSVRSFTINAREHHLYLVKQLTRELSREEVKTWKRVIRVITHELNNSLAPIASLASTAQLLDPEADAAKLDVVFTTIEARVDHLSRFIEGYARFAKLPSPRPEPVEWASFLEQINETTPFVPDPELPPERALVDPAQLEQVLINILKNAREAGSPRDEIQVTVRPDGPHHVLSILDRGTGMSEAVLSHALLPFYSTKRTGTGLGLALCREIVEAHGGRLSLRNRQGGGLAVEMRLPAEPSVAT